MDRIMKAAAVFGVLFLLLCSASFQYDDRGKAIEVAEAAPVEIPVVTPAPIDWREVMVQAVAAGDEETGLAAQEKLDGTLMYDDLYLLAKIITWECGPDWEDWGIMAIGEVVLNRVASPEFPDTIREVLYQTDPMQYEPVWQDGWEDYIPPERYVRLALRLLDGERVMNDPGVVFQALFQQGSGVALAYHDDILDNDTYFCWSNNLDLYAVG